MMNEDWSAQLTARVAEQMRRFRKEAGLTVQELASACTSLGLPVATTTITNLENRRRSSVDLADFLVIARALDVPPIALLFPLGITPTVMVLPGQEVSAWDAVSWFTGETAMDAAAPTGSPREVLDAFRSHADAVTTALVATRQAKERRRKATIALDPARREALLEAASGYEHMAFEDCRDLRAARVAMRERGLIPPALPDELAFVDQDENDEEQNR